MRFIRVFKKRILTIPDFIPYGRQQIDDSDIEAVVRVLRSNWLTTGPKVEMFENAIANFCGARYGVAVCNGTAALHCATHAAGYQPGDEVIVPAMTFAATANAVAYCGATPVFCDVLPDTLLIDPDEVERKITPKTKGVIAVDYAGQPCDYDRLKGICERHRISLIGDAAHSLGARYKGRHTGTLCDMTVFSFHPVKHITTGEGGMTMTDNPELATRMKRFRNHGITTEAKERSDEGRWFYEMTDLGMNYRISDFQCALGMSQLGRLPEWLKHRDALVKRYRQLADLLPGLNLLKAAKNCEPAWHLMIAFVSKPEMRNELFERLRKDGLGVNVHYIPVHLHPYYRRTFCTEPGLCPIAEEAYEKMITLPLHQGIGSADFLYIEQTLKKHAHLYC